MLLPTKVNLILKKKSCKRNLVWPGGLRGGKIVLKLLTEIVTLHVGLIIIEIKGHELEFIPR